MPQPFVFVLDQAPAQHESLIVLARHHVLGHGHTVGQDLGILNRAHEIIQAMGELVEEARRAGFVEIHHHHREIDAAGRRRGVLGLHDVLFAQDRRLVLQDQHAAPIAVLHDGPVQHELFARLERQF